MAQSSTLLTMPNEVLVQIFTQANAVDQLFLALTCRRLAAVSSMIVITIPSAPKHRADSLDCRAMLSILGVMRPLDANRRPQKSWAPCCDCYRYRPRRKNYWKGVWKYYQREWSGKLLAGYDLAINSWSRKQSSAYQCPECWCEARIRQYAHIKTNDRV